MEIGISGGIQFQSILKRLPLRLVLLAPFVLLLCGAVTLTGILSYRSGRRAVSGVADQLRGEITARVAEGLDRFFSLPQQVNQLNQEAAAQGLLEIDDLGAWQPYLLRQAAVFESLTNLAVGNEGGEYIGVDRRDSGERVLQRCDATTGYALVSQPAGGERGAAAPGGQAAGPYDPRTRPWYRIPAQAGQPRWSTIYKHFVDPALQIAIGMPLYDASGALKGVATAALRLSRIAAMLQTLQVGRSGLAYIVDAEGLLVASSAAEAVFSVAADGALVRLPAEASGVPLIRQTYACALARAGTGVALEGGLSFDCRHGGERLFVRAAPFRDPFGLDWRIFVVLPEADFMTAVQQNVRATASLCLLALLGAIAAGILAARWIARPIMLMSRAAEALAAGEAVQPLPLDRGDEVGRLARAFDRMARQIQRSLESLTAELAERRRVEAALQHSEGRLRLLTDNMVDAISRIDAERRVVYCSPSVERVFGYPPEALMGHGAYDEVHPDDVEALRRQGLAAIADRSPALRAEYRYRHRRGDYVWVESSIRLLYDAQGNYDGAILGSRDITERKRAEEALRESEERFRQITENMREVFWLFDWRQQRVLYTSPAFETIWGRPRQALYERYAEWGDSIHPDDRDAARETFGRILQSGGGEPREYRILRPDGSVRWISDTGYAVRDASGAVQRIAGIAEDITGRKAAEEGLRQANLVVENSPAVLFRWRAEEGWPVVLVSRNVVQFGYTPEELLSGAVPFSTLLHPEDMARVAREVQEHGAAGAVQFQQEYRIVAKDGRVRWVDDRTSVERGPDGRIAFYQGILIDISARKRAEEALHRQTALFRNLFESSPEAIAILDHQDRVLELNRSFETLFGYPQAAARGRPINDLLAPPPYRDDAQEVSQAVVEGGRIVEKEAIRCTRQGRPVHVSLIGYPIMVDRRQVGAYAIYRDITDRKRIEQALQREQEFIGALLENMLDGVVACDADGRLVLFNRTARQWHGLDPMQIPQEQWASHYDLCTADGLAPLPFERVPLVRAFRGERLLDEALVIRARGQAPRYVTCNCVPFFDGAGAPLGAVAVMRDLTEARRVELALRESEERFASFMRHLPGFAFLKDHDRRVLFVNEQFESAFGIPLDRWLGRTNEEIWPGDLGQKIRRDDEAVLASGQAAAVIEEVPTQGALRTYRTVKFPIPRPDGKPWLGGMAVDITELKQAQEALRASLHEKESLLKEVHHRVKNNLQIISSLLQLQARQVGNREVHGFLRDTQNRVRSMALLHETLYRSGNLARVDVARYVKGICEYVARTYASAAAVRLRSEIVEAELDLDQAIPVGLIISELLSNAFKHAFPGGGPGEIVVALQRASETHFRLQVADDGVGFAAPPELAGSATLGLQLVRNLTRQIEGRLSADGRQGARFEIVFPVVTLERQSG